MANAKEIENALRLQAEIFGDDLYSPPVIKKPVAAALHRKEEDAAIKKPVKIDQEKKPESFFEEQPAFMTTDSLDSLHKMISGCTKCVLAKSRNQFVFGEGNPEADVMIIGEGPGAEEDKTGRPFVGRAGKLLTDILKAIEFEREEVYIANIVKCRPPGNRTPMTEEMNECLPYLNKQIELIKPKFILCLGLTAAKGLLKLQLSLTKMRGQVYEYGSAKLMVTYHPAALLRNPNWKRGCWEDVQLFRKLYDESREKSD